MIIIDRHIIGIQLRPASDFGLRINDALSGPPDTSVSRHAGSYFFNNSLVHRIPSGKNCSGICEHQSISPGCLVRQNRRPWMRSIHPYFFRTESLNTAIPVIFCHFRVADHIIIGNVPFSHFIRRIGNPVSDRTSVCRGPCLIIVGHQILIPRFPSIGTVRTPVENNIVPMIHNFRFRRGIVTGSVEARITAGMMGQQIMVKTGTRTSPDSPISVIPLIMI